MVSSGDEPIERREGGNTVHFEDLDGNEICLWEVNRDVVPEPELARAM